MSYDPSTAFVSIGGTVSEGFSDTDVVTIECNKPWWKVVQTKRDDVPEGTVMVEVSSKCGNYGATIPFKPDSKSLQDILKQDPYDWSQNNITFKDKFGVEA